MATPTVMTRQTARDTIARYLHWHDMAFPERGSNDIHIPFQVLRDYLDVLWLSRHGEGPNYSKSLTLDAQNQAIEVTTSELQMLYRTAVEKGWTIRVRGQKWAI